MKIDILNHTVEIVPTSGHINSKHYGHHYGKTLNEIKEEDEIRDSAPSAKVTSIFAPSVLSVPSANIKIYNTDFDHYVLCISNEAPFTDICFTVNRGKIHFRYKGIMLDEVLYESDWAPTSEQKEILGIFKDIINPFIPNMQENTKYKLQDIL